MGTSARAWTLTAAPINLSLLQASVVSLHVWVEVTTAVSSSSTVRLDAKSGPSPSSSSKPLATAATSRDGASEQATAPTAQGTAQSGSTNRANAGLARLDDMPTVCSTAGAAGNEQRQYPRAGQSCDRSLAARRERPASAGAF